MRVVKSMKALVYLRVSTEEQAEKGYSIQAQRIEGMNKATELGCSLEDICILGDEGISGAILERPQLMAALDMLKKKDNNIKYFICYDSSRLSRTAAHQLIIIDEIKKSGTQLIFIKNNYQDNAEGRFQLTVMAAVDEYERARLRLRTEMGKRTKAGQNKLTHNPGLYGYDFDPKTDTLSINEKNAETLRLIFKLLIEEGKGPSEIAEKLNDSDVPSPRMKQWSRVTVRRILLNPSYLGILYIRRYDTRDCHLNKFRSKGEKIKVREKPKDEWVPIKIPQIIDNDTWEKAQMIIKKSNRIFRSKGSTDFLLTPLLKCGICGSSMNGKSVVKANCHYRYYICSEKYKDDPEGKCEAEILRADEIEKTLWDYICRSITSYIDQGIDIDIIIDKYISEKENNIKDIFSKKEKAKKEKERIITMYQKGYIDEASMDKRLNELKKSLMSFDASATRKAEHDADFIERIKKDFNAESLSIIIEDMLKKLDSKGRKEVVGLFLSEITVDLNTIFIKARHS